jgi:hypothetical protein
MSNRPSGFDAERLGPGEVARNRLFACFAAQANTLIRIWVCSLPSTKGRLKQGSAPNAGLIRGAGIGQR